MFDTDQILNHPVNAKLITYLARSHTPSTPAVQTPAQVHDPYYTLGTHPDLVERLWDQLTVLLPVDCRAVFYNTPVLIRPDTGIVFGFAGGTHTYALRLPTREFAEALQAGVQRVYQYPNQPPLDLATIGDGWIFCRWYKNEEYWCAMAYAYAGT